MARQKKRIGFDVVPEMREQAATVSEIEQAMRKKVEEQLPVFEKMPAAQSATTTQGEKVLKANPAMQELRALFRDYCAVVKFQQETFGKKATPTEVTSIDDIRKKLMIAK